MNPDRPKVGDVFRAPDRISGLAGLLGGASSPSDAPAEGGGRSAAEATRIPSDEEALAAAGRVPREASARPPRAARPLAAAKPDQVVASEIRIVPVVLDVSVLSDLRAFAVRSELTQGVVTLRAIEANEAELAKHWSQRTAPSQTSGRLFGNTRTVHRRTEPGVQTQVRMAAADAITLDQLVADWSAPSRSALVNEALRRYVRPSPAAEADRRKATS
jgi:hypothetical protein